MNSGIFDWIVRWSELTGCSLDDALMFMGILWFVFIALFSWAFGFAADLGRGLYQITKELFRFIRCRLRRKEKDEL